MVLKIRFSKTAKKVKEEAELKFKAQDFESALRLANEAKELDPNLHGVQQWIAAYTVHHVAAAAALPNNHGKRKLNNNKLEIEMDWYTILGVSDDSVDTETIKKQYKKMAIMVHPDKNKSVAAEGAFKLISDAWNVLSNQSRRMAYDQRSGRGVIRTTSASTTTSSNHAGFGSRRLCPKCLIPCDIKASNKHHTFINCTNCQREFVFISRRRSSNCTTTTGATSTHRQHSSPPAAAC